MSVNLFSPAEFIKWKLNGILNFNKYENKKKLIPVAIIKKQIQEIRSM